jgi:Fe-S cluster biogenesis protein NfuA
MFIQTEDTPNPQSMKFVPGRAVLGKDDQGRPALGFDIPDRDAAGLSPLAAALFEIEGIAGVYLGSDFVTATKEPDVDWRHVKPAVLGVIADYLTAGLSVLALDAKPSAKPATPLADYDEVDREIVRQIIELIDTRVRPAVAADGGDIVFKHFEPKTGVVFLSMHGSCSGCPSSTLTLKAGIENMLKHYVPEVLKVEAAA